MKFTVTMKDPDTLLDCISEAVENEIDPILDEDEKEAVKKIRVEKIMVLCRKWFEYGEYLRVEIDTEEKTCKVLEV